VKSSKPSALTVHYRHVAHRPKFVTIRNGGITDCVQHVPLGGRRTDVAPSLAADYLDGGDPFNSCSVGFNAFAGRVAAERSLSVPLHVPRGRRRDQGAVRRDPPALPALAAVADERALARLSGHRFIEIELGSWTS
jgi:hypothetical protein